MNSNILSFDFDATPMEETREHVLKRSFQDMDRSILVEPCMEYVDDIKLIVDDTDAADHEVCTYLCDSMRCRGSSFLSTSSSERSRNSSVRSMDTSFLLVDEEEATTNTTPMVSQQQQQQQQQQPHMAESPLLCHPTKKFRRESTESHQSSLSWCDMDCLDRRSSGASQHADHIAYLSKQACGLVDLTDEPVITTQNDNSRVFAHPPLNPSSETPNYEQLLANARAVIDSMSSTIQTMSSRQSQIQNSPWSNSSPNSEHLTPSPRVSCSPSSVHLDVENQSTHSPTHTVHDSPLTHSPQSMSQSPSSPASLAQHQMFTPFALQQHQQQQQQNDMPQLSTSHTSLNITSHVEPVWYAERPFPTFTVTMTSTRSQQPVDVVCASRAQVTMIDGFGNDATDKLSGSGQHANHLFPFVKGTAHISGLRFRGVSSKCGGSFRLIVTVIQNDSAMAGAPIPSAVSTPIQVLSYRLYHAPKVSFEQLLPDDSLSKMKGIGSLYAKRFHSLGIERISQLADIDLSVGEIGLRTLLENLRKDRGAMTMTKLAEYVLRARDICSRAPHLQHTTHTHTVARLTTSHSDPVSPASFPSLSTHSSHSSHSSRDMQQEYQQQAPRGMSIKSALAMDHSGVSNQADLMVMSMQQMAPGHAASYAAYLTSLHGSGLPSHHYMIPHQSAHDVASSESASIFASDTCSFATYE